MSCVAFQHAALVHSLALFHALQGAVRRVAASLLVVLEEAVPAAVLYPALVESRHVHTGELTKLGILEDQLQDYAMHRLL